MIMEPCTGIGDDEIEAYRRDGAVCLRGVFDRAWATAVMKEARDLQQTQAQGLGEDAVKRVAPIDLVASLYHLLGVPADLMLHDTGGRPHRVGPGNAIRELFA